MLEFAAAAAKNHCGTGEALSAQDVAEAAADLYGVFGGVEGYVAYLQKTVQIAGAEIPLNGGAAWQRLLSEIEVAMRLAHPPQDELASLALNAVRAGGTNIHGHARWEDVSSKLMLSIAFGPLQKRIRYVSARVMWLLRQQKVAVAEWMATLSDGPAARLYSPLFAQHLEILRSSPVARDLVWGAFDAAASQVADQLLKNLLGTLTAASINPQIMLRPKTEPDMDPVKPSQPKGRSGAAKERVKAEMRRRSGFSGGLPTQLRDRVFHASEAVRALPYVEARLRRAFAVLARALANQAYAFADTSMSALTLRHLDQAMNTLDFSPEQRRALGTRHGELRAVARQVDDRLTAVRKCVSTLRGVKN